jgi:hypothetical protein
MILLQIHLPGLPDQINAERMVRCFVDKLESSPLIETPGCGQNAIRP